MRNLLFDLHLKSVVIGICAPVTGRYPPCIEVQSCSTPYRRGPKIALRREGRRDTVDVFYTKRLVNSARPHVSDQSTEILGKLPLNRQVPLHHVIPGWVGIEICLSKPLGRVYEYKSAARKRSGWQAGGISSLIKRRRKQFVELDKVRKRQNVKHAESGTDRSLAAAQGVPGYSHAWLE